MTIPIEHITEEELLSRGKPLDTDHLLTQAGRKLQAARDRKDKVDPEIIEIPQDFDAIEAQVAKVRSLQRGTEDTVTGAQDQTGAQEKAVDAIIEVNGRLMKSVDLAIRLKLLKDMGYERGIPTGRSVPRWEKIAEKRLVQAKKDKATLKRAGLKEQTLTDYEKALKDLTQKDQKQESDKPTPAQTRQSLHVEQGKLHYMLVWLCGIFDQALEKSPKEARLFRVSDLIKTSRPNKTKDEDGEGGDDEEETDPTLQAEDGSEAPPEEEAP